MRNESAIKKTDYKGKLFSIMGDSLSTFAGVTPEEFGVFYDTSRKYDADIITVEETWWGRVIQVLGGELLFNNSWSGSLVCKHPDCTVESYGSSDKRTSSLGKDGKSPDVVMVYIGTNDCGYRMRIYPEPGQENDISVFSVAYDTMLRKIRKNYPDAEIWCFTLAVSEHRSEANVKRLFDYSCAIKKCADENGCRLIDVYQPDHPYETIDDLHPDSRGMKRIADRTLEELGLL